MRVERDKEGKPLYIGDIVRYVGGGPGNDIEQFLNVEFTVTGFGYGFFNQLSGRFIKLEKDGEKYESRPDSLLKVGRKRPELADGTLEDLVRTAKKTVPPVVFMPPEEM